MQYIGEKPSDPTTLYVYAGASGSFVLYEDQGTTFDYEKGAFSQIPIHWDDKTATLTLGKRTGSFYGMLDHRTFQIVLVSAAHPAAFTPAPTAAKSAHYTGAELRLNLRRAF
jgi:alpha-D-xyloside xylohydrolase